MTTKMPRVSWGVLSTARIGLKKVIPAMQQGRYATVTAVASRDLENARKAAQQLGIPRAYGSYEELLQDGDIDAVYNPLPNHLHVEWTIKSLQAGKHVLCEKPIGMNLEDAEHLHREAKRFPALKVMEAFMYRHHPQWAAVKRLISEGTIGELKNIHAIFTYYNDNPRDIRNIAAYGGGGLLDIGCYCISVSRFLFAAEPYRVSGAVEYDPEMQVDRLASGVLAFEKGTATFTCSTRLKDHRQVTIFGTRGRIDIDEPFTPSPEHACIIAVHADPDNNNIVLDPCDQYTLQGDLFSKAILDGTPPPTTLEDAVANMRVIDAIFESHGRGVWIEI